jgi:hypothetical protein
MLGTAVPATGDLYLLGGGEDAPQSLAAEELRRSGNLGTAVAGGAAVLAVCAGLQVVGSRFLAGGRVRDGAGLVDVETVRGLPRRAVGELVVQPDSALGLPTLSGYENHAGISRLGAGVSALGRVRTGTGNGTEDGADGFVSGRMVGTYLHGPVLARNPELADLLLGSVLGPLPAPPGEAEATLLERADRAAADLRQERLGAVRSGATDGRPAGRLEALRVRFSRPGAPSESASRRSR